MHALWISHGSQRRDVDDQHPRARPARPHDDAPSRNLARPTRCAHCQELPTNGQSASSHCKGGGTLQACSSTRPCSRGFWRHGPYPRASYFCSLFVPKLLYPADAARKPRVVPHPPSPWVLAGGAPHRCGPIAAMPGRPNLAGRSAACTTINGAKLIATSPRSSDLGHDAAFENRCNSSGGTSSLQHPVKTGQGAIGWSSAAHQ